MRRTNHRNVPPPGSGARGPRPARLSLADALQELKHRLQTGTDFSEISDYFHDFVCRSRGFLESEIAEDHPKLEAILGQLAQRYAPDAEVVSRAQFLCYPEHHFMHGPCQMGRYLGVVFYFTDIDLGLSSLCRMDGTGNTEFARFRAIDMPRTKATRDGYVSLITGPFMKGG
jgi:hypothetical protein